LRKHIAVAALASIVALGAFLPVPASAKITGVDVVNESNYCLEVSVSGLTAERQTAANARFILPAHKTRNVPYSAHGAYLSLVGYRLENGCGATIPKQRPQEFSTIDRTVYASPWEAVYTYAEGRTTNWTLTRK
jgi:hypothetical protein